MASLSKQCSIYSYIHTNQHRMAYFPQNAVWLYTRGSIGTHVTGLAHDNSPPLLSLSLALCWIFVITVSVGEELLCLKKGNMKGDGAHTYTQECTTVQGHTCMSPTWRFVRAVRQETVTKRRIVHDYLTLNDTCRPIY